MRIYVRMYVDAVSSGMIADMGAETWQTLCVLSSFMDADGKCYPTQEMIAHRLGIARETANRRIQKLLKYRWQGKEVVTAEKFRNPITKSWMNTVYTITPESQLAIFGEKDGDVTLQASRCGRHTNYNHINDNHIN